MLVRLSVCLYFCLFLQGRGKGALVHARTTTIKDMDAPTSFFFSLGRFEARRTHMACLRLPDGRLTSDPSELKRHTYSDLFKGDDCDGDARAAPQLSLEEHDISLEELTTAENGIGQVSRPKWITHISGIYVQT